MTELILHEVLLYILTGASAGFAAGLLGIGGGLIIVPALYFIFSLQHVDQMHVMHMALATSLATIVFTSISSTHAHHKKQAVQWPLVLLLTPGIAIGAWLGGTAATALNTDALKKIFGVFELLVAIHLLSRHRFAQHNHSISKLRAGISSGVIGFVSAIVGIGGGTLTVPFLHWHGIAMRKAIATSAACGLPIAIFATASFILSGWHTTNLSSSTLGFVNLNAFTFIVIASYLCAPLGAKAAHSLPENVLRLIFGIILLALSAKMILSVYG